MRQPKQPPQARAPIPAPIAIAAMAASIAVAAALALLSLMFEPKPIVIELAPQDFAATDGDHFSHSHDFDLAAPDGVFPHLERDTGSAA